MTSTLIERILRRTAKRKGAPEGFSGTVWYEISPVAAGKLVREAFGSTHRPPRPGHEIEFPPTTYRGHAGSWALSNRGGQYELMFYYRSTY